MSLKEAKSSSIGLGWHHRCGLPNCQIGQLVLLFKITGCGKEKHVFGIFDLYSHGVLNDAMSYSARYID